MNFDVNSLFPRMCKLTGECGEYLNKHMCLLSEDFLTGLRTSANDILSKRSTIKEAVQLGHGSVISRQWDQRRRTVVYRLHLTKESCEQSELLSLKSGSLVILFGAGNLFFCNLIDCAFEDSSFLLALEAIEIPPVPDITYKLFAFSTYFEVYNESLRVLSNIDSIPLKDYLVSGQTEIHDCDLYKAAPSPISPNSPIVPIEDASQLYETLMQKPTEEAFLVGEPDDSSQHDIIKNVLEKEISLIHGPPGCGKTSIAVKIVATILQNKPLLKKKSDESPVLVLSATNRGLDHLLEQLLCSVTQRLVRIGSRSQSTLLENHNLSRLREHMRQHQLRQRHIYEEEKALFAQQLQLMENIVNTELKCKLPDNILNEATALRENLTALQQKEDVALLRRVNVLGLTVSGAVKVKELLELLQPRMVLIEEAGEILEGHLIAALPSSTRNLVLVGDHLQLRPYIANRSLLAKFPSADASLLERFINAGVFYYTLNTQHRMAPPISELIAPIYSNLTDHSSTQNRPPIPGFSRNVIFLTHTVPEEERIGDSWINNYEAEVVAGLANLLTKLGESFKNVTVLSPYAAQVVLIKKLLTVAVEATTVDSFQGQENDIVLLSLVRSGGDNVGFLASENRVVVSLSRARRGLIILGNIALLSNHSKLWSKIKNILVAQGALQEELELTCDSHKVVTKIKTPKDFSRSPLGGCFNTCSMNMPCNHPCSLPCHPAHIDHQCSGLCERSCERGHVCPKSQQSPCGHNCPPCLHLVDHQLVCGHKLSVPCHSKTLTCSVMVPQTMSCGHVISVLCGRQGHCTQCVVEYRKEEGVNAKLTVQKKEERPLIKKLYINDDIKVEVISVLEKSTVEEFGKWTKSVKRDASFAFVLIPTLACFIARNFGKDKTKERTMIGSYLKVAVPVYLDENEQLTVLYHLQEAAHSKDIPPRSILHWFMALYEHDVIEDDVYLKWKEEINPHLSGKPQTLIQVHKWLEWLQQDEEETDDDDDC